jgi:hypothetical protein
MDLDDNTLEQAKGRVRAACMRQGGIHAVGTDSSSGTVIIYYSDAQNPALEEARQEALRLAAPYSVRFVHSPPASLAKL